MTTIWRGGEGRGHPAPLPCYSALFVSSPRREVDSKGQILTMYLLQFARLHTELG